MSKKNKELTDAQRLAKRFDAVIRVNKLAVNILPVPFRPAKQETRHADDAEK